MAPTSLVTGLLYYFGWVLVSTQAAFFGVDESTFGFSTRDYMLQSLGVLILPLGGVLLFGVLGLWAHTTLSGWLERPDRHRLAGMLTIAIGVVGAAIFAAGLIKIRQPTILPPSCFTVGIGLCAYAVFLRHRWQARRRGVAAPPRPSSLQALNVTLVSLLIALSLFWTVGRYAERVARWHDGAIAAGLSARPSVVVYSAKRLHIEGSGVKEAELRAPDSAEHFRYSGLRLLLRANGKYLALLS